MAEFALDVCGGLRRVEVCAPPKSDARKSPGAEEEETGSEAPDKSEFAAEEAELRGAEAEFPPRIEEMTFGAAEPESLSKDEGSAEVAAEALAGAAPAWEALLAKLRPVKLLIMRLMFSGEYFERSTPGTAEDAGCGEAGWAAALLRRPVGMPGLEGEAPPEKEEISCSMELREESRLEAEEELGV